MDSMETDQMLRALERVASAMEAIRDLMVRRNELLAESLDGQRTANRMQQRQLDMLEVTPLVYGNPLPKENF